MASIYKLRRKGKKEDADKAVASEMQQDDFSPLLFDDAPDAEPAPQKEAPKAAAPIEEPTAKETVPVEEASKEEAPADAPAPAKKQSRAAKDRAFDEDVEKLVAAIEQGEKETPKDILEALAMPEVDTDKLDAVFSNSKGTVGKDSSEAEYDEAAELLREIFGTEHTPKRARRITVKEQEEAAAEETPADEVTEDAAEKESAEEVTEYVADHSSDEEKTRDYVAVHDGDEESTKEYQALDGAIAIEDAAGMTRAVPPLSDEVHVSDGALADDPYSDTFEELDTKYERKPVLPDEYTSPEEYDEFAEHLRNRNFSNLIATFWSLLAFLVILYLESATFSNIYHPEILKPGGIYNTIYLLVDVWMVLVSGILVLSSMVKGIKSLLKGKPCRNSVLFLMHLFTMAHALILLVMGAKEYPLFGSVAAMFAFFTTVANFLDSKRIYRSFRIFGSRKEKLVAKALTGESPEAEAFRDQLDGEPRFFSIQKAQFVDRFFERLEQRSRAERSFGWVILLSFLASVGFAVYSYLKEPNVIYTATSFMTMAAMTLPLSCIFSMVLPFSHLSVKAEKQGSAILSIAAAEEHSAADVVSFTDKEIFPPKSVKITTIRTYGQTRIDKAILYSAMIFQKLGGPLSEVFKKTISGVYEQIPEDFDFKEITADGMCAAIDGADVFVGSKDYLLSYDFGYTKDEQDEEFEAKHGKIMYMVIGSELAAKFYIRYAISKQFKKTVLSLYRTGICPAVKTCDPNIDSDLFRTLLQNNKIPAGIVKSCEAMKDAPAMEHSESGIVCVSSIARLLKTFSICDSLRHLTRANVVMKIISLVLGAGVVFFLAYISGLDRVTGLFAMIYHLLWLIPVIIPSMTE